MKVLCIIYRDILYVVYRKKTYWNYFQKKHYVPGKTVFCLFLCIGLPWLNNLLVIKKELLFSQKPQTLIMWTLNSITLLTSCKPFEAQWKVMGVIFVKKLNKGLKNILWHPIIFKYKIPVCFKLTIVPSAIYSY